MQSLGLFFKFSEKRQRILKASIAGIDSNNEEKKLQSFSKINLKFPEINSDLPTNLPLKCRIYHTGRVLSSYNFYTIHENLDTATQ